MSQLNAMDIAYQILLEKGCAQSFMTIWNDLVERMGYDEKIAKSKKVKVYSAMMLDPRFVSLKENMWDVAERVTYEQKHIDTSEIELDDEDDEIEEEIIIDSDGIDYDNPIKKKDLDDEDEEF